MVTLSIIIPVYNGEKYIKRCLDSIFTQSFENYEVIIVNDGSTDNTKNILDELKNDKLKIYNNENHGVSYSRNFGIEHSIGEYIMFVDVDDTLETDSVKELVLSAHKYNCDVVIGRFENEADNILIEVIRNQIKDMISALISCKSDIYDAQLLGYVCGKLYRKTLLDGAKFNTKIRFKEDTLFNLSIYSKCNKIIISDIKCYNYILNENSASFKFFDNYEEEIITFINEIEKVYSLYEFNNKDIYMCGLYMYMNYLRHYAMHKKLNGISHYKAIKQTFSSELWKNIFYNSPINNMDLKYKMLIRGFINHNALFIMLLYKLNEMRKKYA